MGLHNTAHYLKSHGRGDDTELVHMTKGEVKGLEDLARAKGGSLSINPNTGLKEAGFLSDILPTVVGAGVGIMTGNPMLGAAVGGGLGYATSGGNLNRGIMSGLGAYGGAGLYGGLESAGATALAPQGLEAGNAAIAQSFGGGIDGISNMEEATNLFKQGKLGADQYKEIASTFSQGYAQGIGGSNALMAGASSPSAWGQNLAPLSMLGISALGNFGSTSNQSSINPNPNPGYIRPYTFSQTRNPNYGQSGQPYFNQSYTAQPVVAANQWGSQALPSSGMAAGGLAENEMFPQNQQDSTQFATPTQMPTSAEVIRSDYDPRTDAYTGQPNGFAGGGMIAFAEGGDTPAPWNPESGQVTLQQPMDPRDPNSEMKSTDYTIPKDQIQTFTPDVDPLTGASTGTGAYILKDGSMLGVDAKGVVGSATPGRNDYTLNEQGYYQPTGANLAWDGGSNTLTKKIGGIDVMVPGQYHKGGYQDDRGNLRVDANGVPIPLLPNYLDSGLGKSGMADAAPYITAAMMAAMTAGAAAPTFAGMVPASETLLGSMGALAPAAASAPGYGIGASATPTGIGSLSTGGSGVGSFGAGSLGTGVPSGLGITQGSALAAAAPSAAMTPGAAPIYDFSTPYSGAVNPAAFQTPSAGNFITNNPMTSASLGLMGARALGINPMSAMGGSSGSAPATQLSIAPQGGITPYQYNYNPRTQGYTKRAASGGIMHGDLGGYSDGGRLLKGPGDGVSDSIPAQIGNKQPARLADGEFVIPARIVSELGNGSTDAGAKQLYKMMDRIQAKRRKSKAIAANTKAFKDLPA